MGEKGFAEVTLQPVHDSTRTPVPGCALFAPMEGNRPLRAEVQSVVEESPSPNPKYSSGIDTNRLQIILTLLSKQAKVEAWDKSGYMKVVQGLVTRLREAAKRGFTRALVSHSSFLPQIEGMEIHSCARIEDAITQVTNTRRRAT